MKRRIVFAAVVVVVGGVAGGAPASSDRAEGTVRLNAALKGKYTFNQSFCPAEAPIDVRCVRFKTSGIVPGLGRVTVTYAKWVTDDPKCPVVQFHAALVSVAGKGNLRLEKPAVICAPTAPSRAGPFPVSVVSGTGDYIGASGTLMFRTTVDTIDITCVCGTTTDRWQGRITVPGAEFDVRVPRITGAASRTVEAPRNAKSVRVRYVVKATDAVDGAVPTDCKPRSGRAFKVGRTKVTCSATDSSGNTAKAQFTITVKRS